MNKFAAWFRALTLLQKFSLLSLGWITVTTIVGGAIAGRSAAHSALQSEAAAYSEILQAVDRGHGLAPALAEAHPDTRAVRIAEALRTLRGAPGVVRIKVYDREGTIVWSDEPRYNGLRFDNRRLQRALRGELVYELERRREEEHRFESAELGGLFELYLPLRRAPAGEILGVVEVYRHAAPLLDHLGIIRHIFWFIAVAGGLTIFLSMQVIVRGASAPLLQAERDLREYATGLEQKAQARTRELAAANLSLMLASQRKSEFLAHMSHDLRTLLNSVLGFSHVLEEGMAGPLNEKQWRYVHNIYESGKHLLALLNDILDLAKVEAGRLELRRQALGVKPLLEDALTIFRGEAVKKNLTLGLEVTDGLPSLWADPVRLKQILYNLLSNAVKFTPNGGTITVRAYQKAESTKQKAAGGEQQAADASVLPSAGCLLLSGEKLPSADRLLPSLVIEVTDTGAGIKAEDLPRLFQEFVQLETTQAQRNGGTGLGLALCKRLVELHGGRIWAESEGEGKGSTFTVLLPFAGPGT